MSAVGPCRRLSVGGHTSQHDRTEVGATCRPVCSGPGVWVHGAAGGRVVACQGPAARALRGPRGGGLDIAARRQGERGWLTGALGAFAVGPPGEWAAAWRRRLARRVQGRDAHLSKFCWAFRMPGAVHVQGGGDFQNFLRKTYDELKKKL